MGRSSKYWEMSHYKWAQRPDADILIDDEDLGHAFRVLVDEEEVPSGKRHASDGRVGKKRRKGSGGRPRALTFQKSRFASS